MDQIVGIKYEHVDHEEAITEFVKFFNITPIERKDSRLFFKASNGEEYQYDLLWFYLCRFILRENR